MTYIQYSVKYYKAKKSVRQYYSELTELSKIYAREDKKMSGRGASRRVSKMTALLEFKQKIKGFYAQYEMYLLPFLKLILALVYFVWINSNMGYMKVLDNIIVVLVLALICCILPAGMIIFTGFALMVAHCYALENRSCRFYACTYSFHDDSFPEIQCRKEHNPCVYTTCICI